MWVELERFLEGLNFVSEEELFVERFLEGLNLVQELVPRLELVKLLVQLDLWGEKAAARCPYPKGGEYNLAYNGTVH